MRIQMPAPNGRFGASGAVARPKVCADLEVSFPSERQWKPHLRQAAVTLVASGGRCNHKRLIATTCSRSERAEQEKHQSEIRCKKSENFSNLKSRRSR